MFVLLCHSDYLSDGHTYQLVIDTESHVINKANLYTISDLKKDIDSGDLEKAIDVSKGKPKGYPTGKGWSYDLQRKNYPAEWVTINGSHVLIKIMNHGRKDEHGVVVFAGNSKLEHLKVFPKTADEYQKVKERAAERKKDRKEAYKTDPMTAADAAREKQLNKKKLEAKRKINKEFKMQIMKVASLDGDTERTKITEGKVIGEEVESSSEVLKEIAKIADGLSDREKGNLMKDLEQKSKHKLVDEELKKQLGDSYKDVTGELGEDGEIIEDPIHSKNADVRELIHELELTKEQAMEIARLTAIKKKSLKEVNDTFGNKSFSGKKNEEHTSMHGIIKVDWEHQEKPNDLIENAMKEELTRIRAYENTEYYSLIQDQEEGVNRLGQTTFINRQEEGAIETANILSDFYLEGKGLSSELIDVVGADNAAMIVAGAIIKDKGYKGTLKELEKLMESSALATVIESIDKVDKRIERINDYKEQSAEGVMGAQTMGGHIGNQSKEINRELGHSLGSIQTIASVAEVLRDAKNNVGDVVVDIGADHAKAERLTKKLKLGEGVFSIQRSETRKGRWNLVIPHEEFSNLLTENLTSKERDENVAAIKAGEKFDPDWLPKGTPKENYTVYDQRGFDSKQAEWKSEGVLDKKMEGWEKFKNVEGEKGYTRGYGKNKTLYRKKGKARIFPAPQKMIQFGLQQKRAVMNLGAGTGKTVGFLGTVQELKETGKLKTFAFHTMPSRLRDEFFKDKDKFFPDLSVLELDKVKGLGNKRKALSDAAAGKYDMVISGHDTMKSTTSEADIKAYIDRKIKEKLIADNGGKWRKGTKKERRAMKEEFGAKWREERTSEVDLPSVIAAANPTIVTVDETHEAIQDWNGGDSQRFRAFKKLGENAEYFIPATGTVVKNDIGELASLLHLTRPDIVPDPIAYKKQWEGVNQGTSIFGDRSNDPFRRSYDNVMLTEHLKLEGIKLIKHEGRRYKPTPKQAATLKQAEETYQQERSLEGVAVMAKDGYELIKTKGGDVKTFDVNLKHFIDPKTKRPTPSANKKLKELGYDPTHFELAELGSLGAASRRESRYAKTLNNGDWKENVKFTKMAEDIDKHKGERQLILTNRLDSVESTAKMLEEKYGYKENEDFFIITGKVKNGNKAPKNGRDGQRGWKVQQINESPNAKIMVANEAGMTGLNMQGTKVVHWIGRPNAAYKEGQGNARSFRTGQDQDVNAYYHETNTVLEDRIRDNVMRKKSYEEAVGETPDSRAGMASVIAEGKKRTNRRLKQTMNKSIVPKLILNV